MSSRVIQNDPQSLIKQLQQDLKLPENLPYITKDDLTEGSNAFLNAIGSLILFYSKPNEPLPSAEELRRIGRESYETLVDYFQGEKLQCTFEDFIIQDTSHTIPVRLYKQNASNTPLIIYAHGGGWTRGNLKTHDVLCRKLSNETGLSVLAVDYRLAPEHPYPAALDDMEAIYNWALKKFPALILAGDSAGGNLVTSLTMKLRDLNLPQPEALILLYPSLDLRIPTSNNNPYDDGYFLTRFNINKLIIDYLQDNLMEAATSPLISPILETNLKDFPKVIMVSAECDPLQEEAEKFAKLLQASANKVEYLIVPKVIHAFMQFFGLYPEANEAIKWIAQKINSTLSSDRIF
ncbi:MAG: alpha/beta hydrolase [Alphaproteobacteria bacterium]|nr:alpha/beta hydrolase [Alphaproteobacteria bacterium]